MNGGGIITIIAVSYEQRDYSSSVRTGTIARANRFDYYSITFASGTAGPRRGFAVGPRPPIQEPFPAQFFVCAGAAPARAQQAEAAGSRTGRNILAADASGGPLRRAGDGRN